MLVNMSNPQSKFGRNAANFERNARDAYEAAFQVVSKKESRQRRLITLALLIALVLDILLLMWISDLL